jgi:uncharacterized membrane protein
MMPIYRKLIEILATFVVGAALALTSIVWISSGITDENSQIAAAFLGLVGCGISAMSLIAVAIIALSSEKKWQKLCQRRTDGSEKTGN